MVDAPNFSARVQAYPWAALPRRSRDEAALESALARWLAATSVRADRLRALLRIDEHAPLAIGPAGATSTAAGDPYAARCAIGSATGPSIAVRASSIGVRALVQRMLGGPAELAAARPLSPVEESLFALVVATALEDLGVAAHVWPLAAGGDDRRGSASIVLDVQLGDIALVVEIAGPHELRVVVPPRMSAAPWLERVVLDVPVVVGRCAVHRASLTRLTAGTVITLERPVTGTPAELAVFEGAVGLRPRGAGHKDLPVEVATGYVPRDMSLPDDAHVELTVALGTTRMSLREITGLAVGQIVQLGRPLAGPFELRAAGRVLGRGELVDVDGELAVRIVSLGD